MSESYLDLDGLRYYNLAKDVQLAGKVDKENGKGLSSNDYTTSDMTKLSNIESGAQVNVIEGISVNGDAQTVTLKSVNISVPTNNNQLVNGAGYQTASDVNTAIASAIAGIETITKQIVQELPQSGSNNVIYLVPNGASSGQNVYDEYMWINNAWEKTGSSDIDLSGYVQVGDIVAITNAEIDEIISPSTP